MSNYYCLVAGLPDLSMDESKKVYSVTNFKEELYPNLSSADKKLIDLYFLKYDNHDLLKLLKHKNASMDKRGNFTAEQLGALINSAKEGDTPDKTMPSYFYEFLEVYFQRHEEEDFMAEDYLAGCYFNYAMKCSNRFVSAWFEFNLNVNNLLAAYTSRKYKLDVASNVIGSSEICEAIRTSTARDFGLTGILDYFEKVQHISETDSLVEKEKKIDQLKWDWMETESFFNYFSIEKIFVFLLKLELIERWNILDKEKGNEMFRNIIQHLKDEVKIPEDYQK